MFIVILIFSFFYQINANADIINFEDLVAIIEEQFKGNYGHRVLMTDYKNSCDVDRIVTTYLCDDRGGARRESVSIPSHLYNILMNVKEPSPKSSIANTEIKMEKMGGGTRNVIKCSIGGVPKVCFKQWPEAPGTENAVYLLGKTLSLDALIPRSIVIVINEQIFLVSEFMEGESLYEVAKKIETNYSLANKYIFNTARIQALAILCFFIVPEDCRLQNILVRKMKDKDEYELVLIDNERSYGHAFTEISEHSDRGEISTRVHCALFCFHKKLRARIDDVLCNRLISLEFLEGLQKVAEGLKEIDRNQRNLFRIALPNAAVRRDCKEKTMIGIPHISPIVFESINSRIKKFVQLIKCNSDRDLVSIITEIEPKIADIYKFNRSRFDTKNVPELIEVLNLLKEVDSGRTFGPTPDSAYVSPKDYWGITKTTPTPTPITRHRKFASPTNNHSKLPPTLPIKPLNVNFLSTRANQYFGLTDVSPGINSTIVASVNPGVYPPTVANFSPGTSLSSSVDLTNVFAHIIPSTINLSVDLPIASSDISLMPVGQLIEQNTTTEQKDQHSGIKMFISLIKKTIESLKKSNNSQSNKHKLAKQSSKIVPSDTAKFASVNASGNFAPKTSWLSHFCCCVCVSCCS